MLSEEQIVRFSRQLLLAQVGGTGQRALLSCGARLRGAGPAIVTAAAHLSAGGTPVKLEEGPAQVSAQELGFALGVGALGRARARVLEAGLASLGLRGEGPPSRLGCLAALPSAAAGEPPWVAIGGSLGAAVLVHRGSGCAGCFGATCAQLGEPPAGALAVAAGALAAWAFQRQVLGLAEPLGAVRLDEQGTVQPLPVLRCGGCA
jgi:molybdopterin-synthase adenylyltransferase